MKYECKLYLDEEEGKPAADIKIKLDGVKDLRAILREKKKLKQGYVRNFSVGIFAVKLKFTKHGMAS